MWPEEIGRALAKANAKKVIAFVYRQGSGIRGKKDV